jgi:hypothetical protein
MFEFLDDRTINYPFFNLARREHNDSIASNTRDSQEQSGNILRVEWFDDPQ